MKHWITVLLILVLYSVNAQDYAIENVNLISMAGAVKVISNQTVIVQDGKIVAIDSFSNTRKAKGVRIDGTNKFLIPGFIDCYTHVHEKSLLLDLANGVTTVVNAIGEPYQHQLKKSVETGETLGPRIFSVGSPLASAPPVYHTQGMLTTEDEARMAVRETRRLGYDAVFLYVNVNEPVFLAALEEARILGMPVLGHTPFRVSAENRFHPGLRSHNNLVGLVDVQSGQTFPNEQLRVFAEQFKMNNTWLVPTLTIHKARWLAAKQDSLRASPLLAHELPRQKAYWHLRNTGYSYQGAKRIVQTFYEAGVRLLIGTDGGFHFVPHGFSYPMELKNFSEAGIPNEYILKAATIDAARYLAWDDKIGTIEVGKEADLVLLNADPLADIENVKQVAGVMIRGKWLDRKTIDNELAELKNSLTNLSALRVTPFKKPAGFTRVAEYTVRLNGVEAGEESVYRRQNPDGRHTILSQNVIDPPLMRHMETEWSIGANGAMTQMKLTRTGTEGKTELVMEVQGNRCTTRGSVPLHGKIEISSPMSDSVVLAGPNTSVNIDMDLVASLQLMTEKLHDLTVGQSREIEILKTELNSEEWGNDAILGRMTYLFTREPDRSLLKVFRYTLPGFNGSPAFKLSGTLEVDEKGVINSVLFDDSIFVQRKNSK